MLFALLHGILKAEISLLTLTGTVNSNDTVCPPQVSLEQARVKVISTAARGVIENFIRETYDILQECGSGEWHTVVNLDMIDPSQ